MAEAFAEIITCKNIDAWFSYVFFFLYLNIVLDFSEPNVNTEILKNFFRWWRL